MCLFLLATTLALASGGLDPQNVGAICRDIENDPTTRVVRNALYHHSPFDLSINASRLRARDEPFSNEITPSFSITDQKHSGRCWIFTGLNLLRTHAGRKYSMKDFSFSAAHLFFYDQIEKANLFLETVIAKKETPLDTIEMQMLLRSGVQDGGYWIMFVNLVEKYGLVPESLYPDNASVEYTRDMNRIINTKMRQAASVLRAMDDPEEQRARKEAFMRDVYRILVLHMGTPPTRFNYTFTTKEGKIEEIIDMTPQEMATAIGAPPLSEYVILSHSPRPETPYHVPFRAASTSNMVGKSDELRLNLPLDELKKIAITSLRDNEPFWMACDILLQSNKRYGLLDAKLYDLETLYGIDLSMSKGERLRYFASGGNHAMLLTGVHLKGEAPTRWKVENSWGPRTGKMGYFTMTDDWFDEHLFEIAVHKKYLPEETLRLLEKEAYTLPAWDALVN